MESVDWIFHIKNIIEITKSQFISHPTLTRQTGHINTKGGKTIEMDSFIEKTIIDYAKENKLPVKIYSEEIGIVDICDKPTNWLVFDPLDGSTNYRVGKNFLPYGLLIAVYNNLEPKIGDVIVSASCEATRNTTFYYYDNQTFDNNGNPVALLKDWQPSESTPLYVDLHKEIYYDTYRPIVQKMYIRNTGSTLGNTTYLLGNAAAGMGHPRIKAEEVGTVYSLVKGAGGTVVTHSGEDLGTKKLDFESRNELLAGPKNITDFLVETLNIKKVL